ncbi:MAG: eight transmembrane protein [Nitrospira sp. OLB3]|nr:MAG: eight transmembrane protein [Nitrospira sp. OLB3]RIK57311.1 MAG: VPLPA-CTERM-specific exosortase XrtD [Nitrospira sp.]
MSFSPRCFVAVIALIMVALLGYMYADSLVFLVRQWGSDDYSHGSVVPLISLFLVWQRRQRLTEAGLNPSWSGPFIVFAGLLLYFIGNLATLYVVSHLSLWIVIVGLVLSFLGVKALRELAFPVAYLLTAIPLPVFLYNALSSRLQLWSSALGVGVLQFIGVTAFREGNVIDLGPVQLQVAEACSGIRYLFPLTALALLCAYCFRDRMWKRIVLVLSALPISVLVNGLRIGIVGVLVEWYGPQAADGFLHLFEGWVLFMATLGLIVLEMLGLSRIQPLPGAHGLLDRFRLYDQENRSGSRSGVASPSTATVLRVPAYIGSLALILPAALFSWSMGDRQEATHERAPFVDFAMRIGEWQGTPLPVEPQFITALRFDDYLLADYATPHSSPITLYMAYYQSQRKGQSAHSPQSCIPGGGWEISSHRTVDVVMDGREGLAAPVNVVLIQKDREKQLVVYWFKQRHRWLASEYLVKFYLFWDALTSQRSDGALIRLSAAIGPGENEADVEQRVLRFARTIEPQLSRYIPD